MEGRMLETALLEKRQLGELVMKFLEFLDYTEGNCREDDPVGLALPEGVIREAKSLLYRFNLTKR